MEDFYKFYEQQTITNQSLEETNELLTEINVKLDTINTNVNVCSSSLSLVACGIYILIFVCLLIFVISR